VDKPKGCVVPPEIPNGDTACVVNGVGGEALAPKGDRVVFAEDPKGVIVLPPPNGDGFCIENES
jgi:hypothetical protein